MADISGFGIRVTLIASQTFPTGLQISQFADDTDPFDAASIQIRDKAMGVNGDLISWSKATPLTIALGIIPDGDDDRNLQILFEANRAGKDKTLARDAVTITAVYPDGRTVTYKNGIITDGMPSNSVQSAGRFKSKVYSFAFENVVRA